MAKKRLLTIDDLVKFCSEQKFTKFSSKEYGQRIAVQVPTTFEMVDEADDDHRGMLKIKCRLILEGKNKNGSYSSKEAADNAAPTIKNRPVLGHIHQCDDGTWDFESHNMVIVENDEGEAETEYIEKQIGSFSSEKPFWEHDDELDRNYLCAYAYIPEEYTKACDILRAKGGKTRSSVELSIEEMAFNAKERYLDLQKYYVSAETLLGSHDDGTEVMEGMQGCAASIVDFSEQNNSVFAQDKVIEMLEEINQKLSNFAIDNSEGKEEDQVDENVMEVNEEEVKVEESAEEEVTTEEMESTEDTPSEEETTEDEKFSKTFELSHEDIRVGLYTLLSPFEDEDNDWYMISQVFDNYFIYEGFFNADNIYRQGYTTDGDNVSFDGDRVHLNREYLTDNELAELNAMRSNYAEIESKLQKYEDEPKKQEVLTSESYSKIAENDEFKALVEDHFDLSVEELTGKCDQILLNAAKAGTINFEAKPEKKPFMALPTGKDNKVGRYGSLFKK